MISQRRISRGVERPADGEALKAASVIGKVLTKDAKGVGQNNHLHAPVMRSTSLMESSNNMRRTSSITGSKQTSLKRSPSINAGTQVRTRSIIRNDPKQRTTNLPRSSSLVVRKRGVTQEDAQSAFDDFGGPQQRGVIHKSPSMPSISGVTSAKTVKKYVPSAKGLIAIEVPVQELQQQKQQAQEQIQRNRSITRSTSRTNSLTGSRTNSLMGPRSASLSNSRTNSIRRSTSRSSSLTGQKTNLQPPKSHNSLNSASLGNIPKRNQSMPTPLEEEEEDTTPSAIKRETKPSRIVSANLPTNAASSPSTATGAKEPSGISEPSGRAKTVRTVRRSVPTSKAKGTSVSTGKSAANPPDLKSSQPKVSPSPSGPSKNRREVELYEQPDYDQDIILEDEREDEYDDSDKRIWDKKLESVINQSLDDEPRKDSSIPSSVSPPAQTPTEKEIPETATSVNSPTEAPAKFSSSEELNQLEKEKTTPVPREYDGGEENGKDEEYELQAHKNELEPKPQEDLADSPLDREEFYDQPKETATVPAIQLNNKTETEKSSQNRLRDYLLGTDEPLEQSGHESTSSSQNLNDSAMEPLNTSPHESPTPETDFSNNSTQEDQLAKEVRRELDIMGQNGNNENSDENSDELFVDSREDILNDYEKKDNEADQRLSHPPERNPDRQNAKNTQADGSITKVPSPIKSALKKTNSDGLNSSSAYSESSPANQAYLSLTTAENTRLNAQLTGVDAAPRKTVNRSRSIRNSKGVHSLSPPPKYAAIPKRHSHHVGIKSPAEKKAAGLPPTRTKNSMVNTPSRNQQSSKSGTVKSKDKSKLNNSILYPREPPQRRSSFEKYRNKNSNVSMSKMSLRDGAVLEDSYQQSMLGNNFKGTTPAPPSASSSGNESGGSSALFSSTGFKSRFQDSDSEDEGPPYSGAGDKSTKQANINSVTNGNGNGFSLFRNKNKEDTEVLGKKLGKFSSKSSNGVDQNIGNSATKRFGGDPENKTRTLRDEIPMDDVMGEGGKRNVFGKKLKKLFGRNK